MSPSIKFHVFPCRNPARRSDLTDLLYEAECECKAVFLSPKVSTFQMDIRIYLCDMRKVSFGEAIGRGRFSRVSKVRNRGSRWRLLYSGPTAICRASGS